MLLKQKKIFSLLFLSTQIGLLFFYISNQSKIIELNYDIQKLEKKKEGMIHQFDKLKQTFFQLKKYQDVKSFLTKECNFEKVKMEQLKHYEHQFKTEN